MATLISRKEAMAILDVPRRRFEAFVDEGVVTRVCPRAWTKGMYPLREVQALADELQSERRERIRG